MLWLVNEPELNLIIVVIIIVRHWNHSNPSIVEIEVSCADLSKHLHEQVLVNCRLLKHICVLKHAQPHQLPLLLNVLPLLFNRVDE